MPQFPTDPTGSGGRHAVAVLRDERSAADAREHLLRMGLAAEFVEIGGATGDRESVRAEMRAEMENAYISPQAGVAYTKEGLKGITALMFVAVAACVVLAIPVVFLAAPDWPVWLKLLVAAIVGAMAGGTIAVVGGAAGARGPAEPLGAEQGVTLRVGSADAEVLEALRAHDPIRIDVVLDDGTPVGQTLAEEPDHSVQALADRLVHQTDTDWDDQEQQTEREWGARDDAEPERP